MRVWFFVGFAIVSSIFLHRLFVAETSKEVSQNITLDTIETGVHDDVLTSEGGEVLGTKEVENVLEFKGEWYTVVHVVDGDTIDVDIDGEKTRIRMIGLNTPETKDPRKEVECFGVEASEEARRILFGKYVRLEMDGTQQDRDVYGRLLRYVYLENGTLYNRYMIERGFGYEYTYRVPYLYQQEFRDAQSAAQYSGNGLWASDACSRDTVRITPDSSVSRTDGCTIKGNISSSGSRQYHTERCPSYNSTKINESVGERWFCTEEEALGAGWIKAGNCP